MSESAQPGARLRSFPPFDVLGADALDGLGDGIREVALDTGAELVRAGERADELYLLLTGEVAVLGPAGERGDDAPVLATLGSGSIVGEIAVLTGGTRSATLVTTSPVTALAIDAPTFTTLLEREPALGRTLAATASSRLRSTRLVGQLQRLFPGPGAAALETLVEAAEFVPLRAGAVVFHEGEVADAAYVVVTGRVRVLVRDVDGGWQEPIAEIGAGELVGELALLDDATRSATVVASRDTQLARLSREAFEALVVERPEGMLAVTRTIVSRLRDDRDRYRRAHSDHAAIGLVPLTPGVAVDELATALEARLQATGSARRVTRRQVEDRLGIDGIAQAGPGDPRELRLVRWLDEVEAEHALVLLQADPEVSAWTHRCIERVDHLVLVADAGDDADLTELERVLVAARELPHQRVSLVLLQRSDAERPRGTDAWLAPRDVDDHFHVRPHDPGDLDRLARHLAGRALWLVLGGGGAKGFAHLGVIRAMDELGLPIDGIAGSSMGSPLAALVAVGTPVDELVTRTTEAFAGLLDYTVPISGLISGRRISDSIQRQAGDLQVEDTWRPLLCVSTNLTRSRVVVHRRGPLDRALRASVSIPGVMPPVAMGEDLLVDGGVMNNLPVDVVRRASPTGTVIASDVAPKLGPRAKGDHGLAVHGGRVLARRLTPGLRAPAVPRLVPTLMRSLLAAAAETRDRQVEAGLADLHLAFELRGVGLLAFDEVAPVAQRGHDESFEQLAAFAADWHAGATSGR